MKTCKRCRASKPNEAFHTFSRNRDGLDSWCAQCHRERNSEWAKENRERLTIKAAAWRAANPVLAAEVALKSSRKLSKQRLEYSAAWAKANPEKRRAIDARHRAAKRNAVPAWADSKAIAEFYRNAPVGFQVDHIVPLVSPYVCGLHWEGNLQYLTPAANQSKRNFWWPDMPHITAQRQQRMFA